jgi:hypothetical protein
VLQNLYFPILIDTINKYDKIIHYTSNLVRAYKIYPKVFKEEEHKFFDKALFTVLNHLDLAIGLKYVDISQAAGNQLEANYFSRVLILTSHEILNDLNKMLGKDLRLEIQEKIGIEGMKEIDESTKELNILRKKHLKKLKDLRNSVLGHKYEYAYQQAEMIVDIDVKEIYNIGNDIFNVQMKFIQNYRKMLEKI